MKVIHTENAPAAVGPYSQATECGNLIFTSGQLAINPETGELINDTIENATLQSLKNVKAILEEAGSSIDKVLKTTVFLSDIKNFGKMNGVYEQFFGKHKPARSCYEVANLPKAAIVEIEVIAEK